MGAPAAAQVAQSCKTSPNLVGACFSVHGQLFIGNGARQVHIAWTETGRVLDVLDRQSAAQTADALPSPITALFARFPTRIEVEGDYVVCPFDRTHLGRTQAVCIQDASHLIARHS